MKILGFQESFEDWDEGLAAEVFTGGCNYHCPSCHARELVTDTGAAGYSIESVLKKLEGRKSFAPRVIICGGEPTIHPELEDFLQSLRGIGMRINLNTNGSNPDVLERIRQKGLADYIAMDIKAPPQLYKQIIGLPNSKSDILERVERSVGIAQRFPGYEFRTTVSPVYRDNGTIGWMTVDEVRDIARWMNHLVLNKERNKHHLQPFVTEEEGRIIDSRFAKENLPEAYHETPENLLKDMQTAGNEVGYAFQIR